jgi:hypothetical protein
MAKKWDDGIDNKWVKRAMARDLLVKMTCDMLVRTCRNAELEDGDAKYLGQIVAPVEFLHSVADHICVMEPDEFSEAVIQDALLSVAQACDQLVAEYPVQHQRSLLKPWQDGVLVN